MLSSVLRSALAIRVNIEIMRAFVALRHVLESHRDLADRLDDLQEHYDEQFAAVFQAIRRLMTPPRPTRTRIGFRVSEPPAAR
jgi:hypothetical protein